MNTSNISARWSAWAPRLQSILRIVAAFLFMQVGTAKLFAFPAAVMPGGGTVPFASFLGVAGTLETFGGLLMLLGLFTRPVAFILSGEMASRTRTHLEIPSAAIEANFVRRDERRRSCALRTARRSEEAIARNWLYPFGLRRFSRPAALLLVAVAEATASSSRLANTRKSLATRPEGILRWILRGPLPQRLLAGFEPGYGRHTILFPIPLLLGPRRGAVEL